MLAVFSLVGPLVGRDLGMLRTRIIALPHDSSKRRRQFGPGTAEFLVMMEGEFGQHLLALGSQRQKDFPAIIIRPRAVNKSACFQAVHQFDGAMVADFHTTG